MTYDCRGTQGGRYSMVLGAVKLGGGEKNIKIDAFNKLIIFFASLSL
jgi:hypothetical protein